MFESLSDKLQNIIAKTSGQNELTQENMQDALREIRRALLDADVNLRVVKSFISNIKDKAEGEDVIHGVNPSQQLVKIVHDELISVLGKELSLLDVYYAAGTSCRREQIGLSAEESRYLNDISHLTYGSRLI